MNPLAQPYQKHLWRTPLAAALITCAGLALSSCATSNKGSNDSHTPTKTAVTTAAGSLHTNPQNHQHKSSSNGKDNDTCATENLEITTSGQQGAAGSVLLNVILKNTGKTECQMEGYPGISLVTDNNGTQLGKAADREKGVEPKPITLLPSASATAAVKITNVLALNPATCQPHKADGLRVYPPNETKAAFVPLENIQGCSGDVSILSVQPVTLA